MARCTTHPCRRFYPLHLPATARTRRQGVPPTLAVISAPQRISATTHVTNATVRGYTRPRRLVRPSCLPATTSTRRRQVYSYPPLVSAPHTFPRPHERDGKGYYPPLPLSLPSHLPVATRTRRHSRGHTNMTARDYTYLCCRHCHPCILITTQTRRRGVSPTPSPSSLSLL